MSDYNGAKKTLTLFCQVFYPDEQSTAQLFADWTAGLAGRGWDIRVVCGFPPNSKCEMLPAREKWKGVSIHRVGIRVDFKRSLALRAIHYAAYLLGSAMELLRDPERLALVVTNPPFLPIWGSVFRKLRKGRYLIEIQDLYPEGLVELGLLRHGMITRVWRGLNHWALSGAESIIVLGRDMKELLLNAYGLDPDKIRVISHWSPVEPACEIEPESTMLLRELGMEGNFVIQYSGNMGLWHDMDQIVSAADLVQHDRNIQFLLIGDGRRRGAAKGLAEEKHLNNISWLPPQPKTRLEDSLAACHASIISQRSGLEGLAVPCKLYGIMASGRAIIAAVPESSETAHVVLEEECGYLVRPGDAKALAQAIRDLADNPEKTKEMGLRGRRAYLGKYTLVHALERFEETRGCQSPSDRR